MKRLIFVMFISPMFLAGCSRTSIYYGGVKPIYPDAGHDSSAVMVDSLTPTFRWQPDVNRPCTYDFAIWDHAEEIRTGNPLVGYRTNIEFRSYIYYKEALPLPEHKIEIPLAPSTVYYWSVRIRSGDKVSEWAYLDYLQHSINNGLLLSLMSSGELTGNRWFYDFRTPKADKK